MSFGGSTIALWNDIIALMEPSLAAKGYTLITHDPQFRVEQQVQDWKSWIAQKKVKSIMGWPINADAQGTPQQVRAVIDEMSANDIPCIFSESTVSSKPAEQVARTWLQDHPERVATFRPARPPSYHHAHTDQGMNAAAHRTRSLTGLETRSQLANRWWH